MRHGGARTGATAPPEGPAAVGTPQPAAHHISPYQPAPTNVTYRVADPA